MKKNSSLRVDIPAIFAPFDGEGDVDVRTLAEQTAYLSSAGAAAELA